MTFAGLRMKKAHVTHPELKVTLHLDIIGVKKNPNGQSYTQLGVLTRGTVIEVNVSELGLVTPAGKVVWGKYAQVLQKTASLTEKLIDACQELLFDMVLEWKGAWFQSARPSSYRVCIFADQNAYVSEFTIPSQILINIAK